MAKNNINVYVLPRTDEHQVSLHLLRISICLPLMRESPIYLASPAPMLLHLLHKNKH
jgi:hypothetical protein